MTRFGKPSGPLLTHKQSFFDDNDIMLADRRKLDELYTRQPHRVACKCCSGPLGAPTFQKQGVDFIICERCGHLNGAYEDSEAFCAAVYVEDGGTDYAKNYTSADRDAYRRRMEDIYLPKVDFLQAAFAEVENPKSLVYADFGAGAGYFVAALRQRGLVRSSGYEVSKVQVGLANAMIGEPAVVQHELETAVDLARNVEADVASMIGVLEHVQKPRELLAALRENPRLRYLYISVPLFSPCVFFEMVFPNVLQRQLSGAHTHLYTERSLDWTCREFGLERVAEWWFGTDLVDLYRCVAVELERRGTLRGAGAMWREWFAPMIDDLQLIFDKRKLASEVHMLLRFVS